MGDEIHFLLECSKFRILREEMLTNVTSLIPGFNSASNGEKFSMLVSSDNISILLALGKFTYNAWKTSN